MKKISILLVMVLVLAFVFNSYACPVEPITPIVVVVASGGGGVAIGFIYPILIEAAFIAAISPWLIMYHDNPQCRKETNVGDMVDCIQTTKK